MDNLIRLPTGPGPSRGHSRGLSKPFFFTRYEMGQLMALYSSRVAAGEWRDYAFDQLDDMAVFSIFRHTHEKALFSVAKVQKKGQRTPSLALYSGQKRMKSASSLLDVIDTFDKLPRLVQG